MLFESHSLITRYIIKMIEFYIIGILLIFAELLYPLCLLSGVLLTGAAKQEDLGVSPPATPVDSLLSPALAGTTLVWADTPSAPDAQPAGSGGGAVKRPT